MTLTKNTLRFYLRNRFLVVAPFFMWWIGFCSKFTACEELWALLFFPAVAGYMLLGVYVTDNPNSSEYLFFKKWIGYLKADEDGGED